jgi:SHS2 domain-containing protein/2'-5' RNA ligase
MMKRAFFAFETIAPWPEKLPSGRILKEQDRHLTVAFLGQTDFLKLQPLLETCPLPDFKVGKGGIFNKCLFLPERHPNVAAWHIEWLDNPENIESYRETLILWLQENDIFIDTRHARFLSHVTIARKPQKPDEWKKAFHPLPVMITNLHLYESLGNSQYRPLWTHPIKAPFEEIDHTADIAFVIRGKNLVELHNHARLGLAFHFPSFLRAFSETAAAKTLDDIIIDLNATVASLDQEEGCPFKAVSFHGSIAEQSDKTLEWEMIVDV